MKNLIYFLFAFAVMISLSPDVEAQTTKNFVNPLGTTAVPILSDTVTNTATNYLSVQNRGGASTTTVQVVVTKISGTVGGTISLQGSVDGTSYKALNTAETQTALATITATDASNVYHWRLSGNPFPYYRVSWTGTGTMAASFAAKIFSNGTN